MKKLVLWLCVASGVFAQDADFECRFWMDQFNNSVNLFILDREDGDKDAMVSSYNAAKTNSRYVLVHCGAFDDTIKSTTSIRQSLDEIMEYQK